MLQLLKWLQRRKIVLQLSKRRVRLSFPSLPFPTFDCLSGTMDFSSLSLHQTKRKEMDAQVKVLELEKALEQAKQQLYKLRKQHYQMAGEDAGWSQDVCTHSRSFIFLE